MNSRILRQYDDRWAKKPYPGRGYTVGGSGCGLLACTHIAIEQESKKNWTPENLRLWMIKKGFATYGNGTTWSGMVETLKHIGHKNVIWITEATPMKDAFAELNKGNRIGIFLFYGGYSKRKKKWYKTPDGTVWTGNGHYVAFTSYKYKNGKHWFYTKDSGGRKHDGWYAYETSMKGCVGQMFIVEKVGAQVTPKKAVTKDGKLAVDGIGGVGTVKRTQEFFGLAKTGTIVSQNKANKGYFPALKSVSFSDKPTGDATVKMMQTWLGISPDGILSKSFVKALQEVLKVKADGTWGAATMKAWQKYLNEHKTPPVLPSKKVTKSTPSKKVVKSKPLAKPTTITPTKAAQINAMALKLAWPAGTDEKKYKKNGGAPTPAFKKAWKKHFPNTKINTGCHSAVRLVLRETVDPKAMKSLKWKDILSYFRNSGLYKELKVNFKQSQLRPGDIRIHKTATGWHIWIICRSGLKDYRFEANQGTKNDRYAHLNSSTSGNEKKHQKDWLFRVK